MEQKKVMLGVKDIQEKIGIGKEHAYRLMSSNQFPIIKVGRMKFVHEEVFENFLKGVYNKR